MEILYISTLSSKRLIDEIFQATNDNPGFAVQKFSRNIGNGIIENGHKFIAFSNPPISSKYTKRIVYRPVNEVEDNIIYRYIPILNISILKHVFVVIYVFCFVLFWGLHRRNDKRIICDTLSISATVGALVASKINKVKCCGVFTDIYGLIVGKGTSSPQMKKFAMSVTGWYSKMFTHYVLLTEDMNELVNPNRCPYIVMEGLCTRSDLRQKNTNIDSLQPKVILYAGGLEEEYGLKMLVDAFKLIDRRDVELHIYGSGTYADELISESLIDRRIKYKGVRPNREVLDAEHSATLLVNPRFTTADFTKYSFPSKNLEYMVSGTPLLTTRLPGMPKEYNDYVYLFEKETIESYSSVLNNLMNLDAETLRQKGVSAQNFVLQEKNNVKQTQRIIDLLQR